MKDLIIFDLQNTLVSVNKKVIPKREKLVTTAKKQGEIWLYSIVEPWTFEVLETYKELFSSFNKILLVKKKSKEDLRDIPAKRVWVIGDDTKAELLFAQILGYESVDVADDISLKQFEEEVLCRS